MHTRNIPALVLILLLVFCSSPAVFAGTNEVKVLVNNKMVQANTPSLVNNGTILVPAKEFLESLGGTYTFNYNSISGIARNGGNELVFRLDDSVASVNGKLMQAAAPMKIVNNRFMLPAEFCAAKLGAETYFSSGRNMLMVFQPVGGKIVYEVMSGDSLWIISQLFGTTVNMLKQLNGLTSDMLFIGQKLVIKETTAFSNVLPAYTTSGATLRSGAGFDFSIAGYLTASTAISVLGKNGDWYKVSTPKGNGYLYYTVVGMKQELSYGQPSDYFNGKIPVDTSMDKVSYIDYTMVQGDSIWSISQKYGIPDYELLSANNITSTTVLYPGQKLKIPVHSIPVKVTPGPQYGEILDWFDEAQYVFPIGKTGKLTDPVTGKSFNVKRTIGAGHSDTETLTAQDSQFMKEIFGGSWSWNRKQLILEVDGRKLAVSVAGMPHAGVDGVPFLQTADNRSDNYGTGPNYDAIAGNGMDGHFDLYFLNCQRHVDNKIDAAHQYNVLLSGGLK